jgi:hypothetical protein
MYSYIFFQRDIKSIEHKGYGTEREWNIKGTKHKMAWTIKRHGAYKGMEHKGHEI